MEPTLFGGVVAALILMVWLYLTVARGRFWLARPRDDRSVPPSSDAPAIVAIVPARDEADCIAQSIGSLLAQNYPGPFSVVLVDDQSRDGTAERAEDAARAIGAADRLTVLRGASLPPGWTGKLWAQHQGVMHAQALAQPPRYLLLTDADIVHAPDTASWLVGRAEQSGSVLVSLMAKLRCDSVAERFLIPAFIFFFAMLYPFAWVSDRARKTAAAAGGCMLVRSDALRQAGGIAVIRRALIDDCALARALKSVGPIWLGLTKRVESIRPYPHFSDIGRMVARSAYAQLDYSPLMLLATVAAMALVFITPVVLALFATGTVALLGAAAWLLMAILFQPILRFYGLSPIYGLLLPAVAFVYILFTVASAVQYVLGRGGYWKGRAQANLVQQ